jgi:hypothetical protein
MHVDLQFALEPVLADMAATCAVQPRVAERAGVIRFFEADGTGVGIGVNAESTMAERVAAVADQAGEWAVEALNRVGLPATWPECPAHRASHPLEPVVIGDVASWRCPKTEETVAAIGELHSVLGVLNTARAGDARRRRRHP